MMTSKLYWLKVLGIGLLFYIITSITSLDLITNGWIACSGFQDLGGNSESLFCTPLITFAAFPISVLFQLHEDILSGELTHAWIYLALFSATIIYFGVFALLVWAYGKIRNKNTG